MRLWLIDIELIDGKLPILTSASIDKALGHRQDGKDGKLCHEMLPNIAPQHPCKCDDCFVTTAQSSWYEPTQHR